MAGDVGLEPFTLWSETNETLQNETLALNCQASFADLYPSRIDFLYTKEYNATLA